MPIEIRELHIKVAVTEGPGAGTGAAGQAAAGPVAAGELAPQALVAECVEQVLRILQNRTER
jgi:hypothetical protein